MSNTAVRELPVLIPCCNPYATNPILRIVLYKNEVHRLPQRCQHIRVLSGVAWITSEAKDIILEKGESILLTPNQDGTLISTPGKTPLVLEIEDR
jgi:hypothetical protein